MAHPTARARARSIALQDLKESCDRLAQRFGVDAPEIPVRFPKDPSHLPTLQLRAVIGFLDSLMVKTVTAASTQTQTSNPKPGRAQISA